MRPKWGQDRVILGDFGLFLSFPRHFGIILATFQDRFGVVLTTLWDHFSAFFAQSCAVLGIFYGHFPVVYGHFAGSLLTRLAQNPTTGHQITSPIVGFYPQVPTLSTTLS